MDPNKVLFTFGKHTGKSVYEVYNTDRGYITFCTEKSDIAKKNKQIGAAINICKQLENSIQGVGQNVLNPSQSNITKPVDNNIALMSVPGGKEIRYGEYINFPEQRIRKVIENLGMNSSNIEKILNMIRSTNNNLNLGLAEHAELFFSEKSRQKDFASKDEWKDNLKICLAWKYGIINDNYKPDAFGTNSIQDFVIEKWEKEHGMDMIICEMTREKTPKEKEDKKVLPRKYCKKIPYLFTPVMYQFLLLGITKEEMKKIHKCVYDNVMDSLVYPVKYGMISELYRLDWNSEYYKFVNNPYAYYTLPLPKCTNIIINSGRNPLNFRYEEQLGIISRFIYDKIKENKWTAIPEWLMKKEQPDYIENEQKLKIDYGVVKDFNLLYFRHIWGEEKLVAEFIINNIDQESPAINVSYKCNDVKPTEEQDLAVRGALSKSVSIITGLAGTGKSSVIKYIIEQLLKCRKQLSNRENFVICSFTAKAVKRVKEILGDEIKDPKCIRTIHSLLNEIDKFLPEYLIIDEASMVSLSLFARLLRKFQGKHINIIMLGDLNQLPPIKYGRPFEDIINSKLLNIHILTKNLRVKGGVDDPIITNSTGIVKSNNYIVSPAENFVVIDNRYDNFLFDIIGSNCIEINNIQEHKFITAVNDDNIELNSVLSSMININKQGREISCLTNRKDVNGRKISIKMMYKLGDPVIFTKNGVYSGVSNGDEGIIKGFTSDHIIVDLGLGKNNNVRIPIYPGPNNTLIIKHMLLAYCITVHKSQGSQWNNVYYYIKGSPSKKFLNKRMTYTAITRASRKCTIIEESGKFTSASSTEINVHYGGLSERLKSNNIITTPQQTMPNSFIQESTNVMEILSKININESGNYVLS